MDYEIIKKQFYKFCDDNGFNPLRSECADWWIKLLKSEREKIQQECSDGCDKFVEWNIKREREKVIAELEKIPFDYEYGYEKCFNKVKEIIKKLKS